MKIISIGNLSLGGTNKTPLTIMLGNHFKKYNFNIAVISLGYKGKLGYKNNIISDGKTHFYSPPFAADEPYLIAQNLNCPVITGKKRKISLEIARCKFSIDIALLDDAFQYKKVKRDVNILILDHSNPVSTGLPFPFGMIRESPNAINRADIILFTNYKNKTIPKKIQKFIINKPHFFIKVIPLYLSNGINKYPLNLLNNKCIYAFCGIAKPSYFLKIIETYNPSVIYKETFKDHKIYTSKIINNVINASEKHKADLIVTTEKDFVKIKEYNIDNLFYIKIDIKIENESTFFRKIHEKLGYSFSCSNENSATSNQKPSLFIKSSSV
jgi:tetraacyldisaccharide 4'-kinase